MSLSDEINRLGNLRRRIHKLWIRDIKVQTESATVGLPRELHRAHVRIGMEEQCRELDPLFIRDQCISPQKKKYSRYDSISSADMSIPLW